MYLRCYVFDHPKNWVEMLPWAQYWYNSAFHHSTGMSPYQAVYSKPPPSLIRYEYNEDDPPTLQDSLRTHDVLLNKLKVKLQQSQNYMMSQADKKRRDVPLEVGDLALVKLQPYRQHSIVLRKNQKLSLRYFGSFKNIEKIGQVAFKLMLLESAKIHPVFHISLQKKFMETRSNNTFLYRLLQMSFDPSYIQYAP